MKLLGIFYYWFCTGLVGILSFFFYPITVYGRENIPKKGGCIFASNHESNLDPMILPVASPRQMRFMAKESLFKGILGVIIRLGGGFPVRRGSADRKALSQFIEELKKGYPVLIFPQGTRGGTRIQPGVGFIAVNSGAPVVPIYIEGSDKALPPGARFPKRSPVRVYFGKPFVVAKDSAYPEAADQIMQSIRSLAPHA